MVIESIEKNEKDTAYEGGDEDINEKEENAKKDLSSIKNDAS